MTIGEITSDAMAFHWTKPPCRTRHGEILSYSYNLTNDRREIITKGDAFSLDVTIANLTAFTRYWFTVAAVTSAGTGPWSESVSANTKEAGII